MKLSTVTPICKVCMKDIKDETVGSLINNTNVICSRCLKGLHPTIQNFRVGEFKATSFYEYTETAKGLIYKFKGCFDYELKDIFFLNQKGYIKFMYKDWDMVPAPSYHEKDEIRGFNHVVEMFSSIGLPIINALVKTKDVKQADLSSKERQRIGEYLKWIDGVDIHGKNILFVDDILTTGSTALSICQMLKQHGAKKVEILVGFHTKNTKVFNLFERIIRSFVAYDLS